MKNQFLCIKKVTKTYFDGHRIVKEALKGVSLDLYQGEVLGLLGVNGAGKLDCFFSIDPKRSHRI